MYRTVGSSSLDPAPLPRRTEPVRPLEAGGQAGIGTVPYPWLARLTAHLLTFMAGAAAMWAYYGTPRQPIAVPSSSSNRAAASVDRSSDVSPTPQLSSAAPVPPTNSAGSSSQTATMTPPIMAPPALTHATVALPDAPQAPTELTLSGLTEPAPGRWAKLPLATSHPIAFVDVRLGDKVSKGTQVFSHWESPEQLQAVKTEVERTRKVLEAAELRLQAAQDSAIRLRKARSSITDQRMQDAETSLKLRQLERDTAQLALQEAADRFTASEYEFSQAFVTSPIDGVVTAVDVTVGERRQATNQFRGVVVLDPRTLNCRANLTVAELAKLESLAGKSGTDRSIDLLNQTLAVAVQLNSSRWDAKILSIGIQANPANGRIPMLLEVDNQSETLPCGVPVEVQLTVRSKAGSSNP
ncbi:MAG: HlyD family efflux transporter periplasmic adaptor subunit [Pirellulales bacterium]